MYWLIVIFLELPMLVESTIPRPISPNTLLFSGKIASLPASPPTIKLLPFIPNAVARSIIPPLANQSIPIFGTLGGLKLNLPVILNFGIFNLGNDQLKFMKPFISLIAPLTVSFALFIGVVIADLSELQTALVFALTESHAPETDVFTELTELDTLVLMLFHLLLMVSLTLFHASLVLAFILFHDSLILLPSCVAFSFMVSQFFHIRTPIAIIAPIATTAIPIGLVKKAIAAPPALTAAPTNPVTALNAFITPIINLKAPIAPIIPAINGPHVSNNSTKSSSSKAFATSFRIFLKPCHASDWRKLVINSPPTSITP